MEKVKFEFANLNDHYLFQELLKEKEIFQAIFEELIQASVGEINEVIREQKVGNSLYTHEISCDLLGITTTGILCDLELQNKPMKYLLNRIRYYVSMLQSNFYDKKKEEPYANVPNCYSVWLCNFDPFKDDKERNTVVPYREEVGVIEEDGSVRIFIDIRKWERFSPKLQELFRFMLDSSEENGVNAKWEVVRTLYKNMKEIKSMASKETEYLAYGKARENGYIDGWYEGESKGIEKGIKEGLEKGIEKGIEKEKSAIIIEMYNKGFDLKMISEISRCEIEKVQNVINSFNKA